jgi:hypothetical protein
VSWDYDAARFRDATRPQSFQYPALCFSKDGFLASTRLSFSVQLALKLPVMEMIV